MTKHDHQDLMSAIGSLLYSISDLQRRCGDLNCLLAAELRGIDPAGQSKLLDEAHQLEALSSKTRCDAALFAIPPSHATLSPA